MVHKTCAHQKVSVLTWGMNSAFIEELSHFFDCLWVVDDVQWTSFHFQSSLKLTPHRVTLINHLKHWRWRALCIASWQHKNKTNMVSIRRTFQWCVAIHTTQIWLLPHLYREVEPVFCKRESTGPQRLVLSLTYMNILDGLNILMIRTALHVDALNHRVSEIFSLVLLSLHTEQHKISTRQDLNFFLSPAELIVMKLIKVMEQEGRAARCCFFTASSTTSTVTGSTLQLTELSEAWQYRHSTVH